MLWVISFKVNIHFSFNSLISRQTCEEEEEEEEIFMTFKENKSQNGKLTPYLMNIIHDSECVVSI